MKIFNFKDLFYLVLIGFGVALTFFYMSWKSEIKERMRVESNYSNIQKLDSTRFAELNLSKQELRDYLEYQNVGLKNKLEQDNIKLRNIEKIINNNYSAKDTVLKIIEINKVVDAIKENKPISVPFNDNSNCFKINGKIKYDGKDSLFVNIENRELSDTLNYVYTSKRKKSPFFFNLPIGRRVHSVRVYSNCGELRSVLVNRGR
jgi:hypothetical protein